MRGVIDKADTGIQVIVASCVVGCDVAIYVTEAIVSVKIAIESILDGRATSGFIPSVRIVSGNQDCIVQIAWVGHSIFLVSQNLLDKVAQLGDVRYRHTTHIQIVIDIIVNGSVGVVADVGVEIIASYVIGFIISDVVLITNDDQKSWVVGIVSTLNQRADGSSVGTTLDCRRPQTATMVANPHTDILWVNQPASETLSQK